MTSRTCNCGCGEPLYGSHRKRFATDACRKRYARSRNGHAPDADIDADIDADTRTLDLPAMDPPEAVPGRCREGLEEWLVEAGPLPAALVAHARALADEVDAAPYHSPLHGRYGTALLALTEATQPGELDVDAVHLIQELSGPTTEDYRRLRYREAETDAERRRWQRLVPVGCLRGEHAWVNYEPRHCEDCGTDAATGLPPGGGGWG